jgi:hypothetical protein
VSVFWILGGLLALQTPFPAGSRAAEGEAPAAANDEARWIPSLAITSGVDIQKMDGYANSVVFEDGSPNPVPLQGEVEGDDLAVSPFVGGSLQLLSPVLPVPTRPRVFLAGEILPTFSSERDVAVDGDPGCVAGPRPGDPCASSLTEIPRTTFGEDAATGTGTTVSAQVDTWAFGAQLGVAFPVRFRNRQLRIKPSFGWINYQVKAGAFVVDADCDPNARCTISEPIGGLILPGFLRETTLEAHVSKNFNGIGPGLEIEMDAARAGPVGVSLFLGGHAYRLLGDRSIQFGADESFDDQLGMDEAVGEFEVDLNPWMYRGHVGIRFHWLGGLE